MNAGVFLALSLPGINLKIQLPTYYDSSEPGVLGQSDSLAVRVFCASLPFIALYQPLGRLMILGSGCTRSILSFQELMQSPDKEKLLRTTLAVVGVGATFFMHPLGLCIASLYDLGCDVHALLANPKDWTLLLSCLHHSLYLGTMLMGNTEVIGASLVFSMALELVRSRKEFQNGRLLEGSAHVLMALVRGAQSLPYLEKAASHRNMPGKEYVQKWTETVDKARNSAAVFFYSVENFFEYPLWKGTSLWLRTISLCKNSESSKWQKSYSLTKSALLSIPLLPMALGGLAVAQISRFTAFHLATKPYIHVKGQAEVQMSGSTCKTFQLNCCLTDGGFALLFGGLAKPDLERIPEIAELILSENPEIVGLQEVSSLFASFEFYKLLSPTYAEFYFHMGATPFILQNNSGLFVASKVAISKAEFQSFSDIQGVESMVNKGFFSFLTEKARYIFTHLSPFKDDFNPTNPEKATSEEEQKLISQVIQQQEPEKPVFVVGDFNTREGDLFDKCVNTLLTEDQASAGTDYLVERNWRHDLTTKLQKLFIDHFLSFSERLCKTTTRAIPTFDVDKPEAALSDHPALVTEIIFLENESA